MDSLRDNSRSDRKILICTAVNIFFRKVIFASIRHCVTSSFLCSFLVHFRKNRESLMTVVELKTFPQCKPNLFSISIGVCCECGGAVRSSGVFAKLLSRSSAALFRKTFQRLCFVRRLEKSEAFTMLLAQAPLHPTEYLC